MLFIFSIQNKVLATESHKTFFNSLQVDNSNL